MGEGAVEPRQILLHLHSLCSDSVSLFLPIWYVFNPSNIADNPYLPFAVTAGFAPTISDTVNVFADLPCQSKADLFTVVSFYFALYIIAADVCDKL